MLTADEWAGALAARLQEMGAEAVARLRDGLLADLIDAAHGADENERRAAAASLAEALGLAAEWHRAVDVIDAPDA